MNYYTTLTSKGQITVPAVIRRKLGLEPGKKLSITLGSDQTITVQSSPTLEQVQRKNRELLLARGFTPAKLRAMAEDYQNGDGITAFVQDKYGTPR